MDESAVTEGPDATTLTPGEEAVSAAVWSNHAPLMHQLSVLARSRQPLPAEAADRLVRIVSGQEALPSLHRILCGEPWLFSSLTWDIIATAQIGLVAATRVALDQIPALEPHLCLLARLATFPTTNDVSRLWTALAAIRAAKGNADYEVDHAAADMLLCRARFQQFAFGASRVALLSDALVDAALLPPHDDECDPSRFQRHAMAWMTWVFREMDNHHPAGGLPLDDLEVSMGPPKAVLAAWRGLNQVPALEAASQSGAPDSDGIVVLPSGVSLPREASYADLLRSVEGRTLGFQRAAAAGHRGEMAADFPHAAAALAAMERRLNDLGEKAVRPLLLLGPPGTGKTELATRMLREMGLRGVTINMASIADANTFGGQSRSWSTAHPSVPLDQCARHQIANPVVVLDELEKCGSGRQNGNAHFVLLSMLESRTAAAYVDPSIGGAVNLSRVCWIATANSLSGIPQALVDRFDVVEVPAPGRAHFRSLVASLRRGSARAGNIDPRLLTSLDDEVLRILERRWDGRSIRKLGAMLQVAIGVQERHLSSKFVVN